MDPVLQEPVAPPPDAAAPMEGEDMQPGGMQQANPEEQEAYEQFVSRAMLLMYDDKMKIKLLDMMDGNGDPDDSDGQIEGLAQAAAMVVFRVLEGAKKAGKEIPGDVLFHAGTEIFDQLADMSAKAEIRDYSQDEDATETAFLRAADQLRMMLQKSGLLDEQAIMADWEKLQQMDQGGQLESMFSGIAANDPRRAAAGDEEAEEPEAAPSRGFGG